jgi:integration host factor subunit alpha
LTDVDNSLLTADELSPQDDLLSAAEGDTLTKAELANVLYEQVGLNKREAKDVVDAFFNEIRDALVKGDSVKLSGFGNFQLRDKPQRPGRNPKTGEPIPISARRVVTFHASQKLKAQVQGEAYTDAD